MRQISPFDFTEQIYSVMIFKIRGYVVDKLDGSGLSGLIIKVNDYDRQYGRILGYIRTDINGGFLVNYEGTAFLELFEKKPRIVLTVESKDHRKIMKSCEYVRFEAGKTGFFWFELDRETVWQQEELNA